MFAIKKSLAHVAFVALLLPIQTGAATAQIRIGQTAGFTGPVAAGVKETTDGAKLYFDAINARGGVNGQTIELLSLDDKFDPMTAGENARQLVEEQNVTALFLDRGTPHTEAIMPVLEKKRHRPVGAFHWRDGVAPASQQIHIQRASDLPARGGEGHYAPEHPGHHAHWRAAHQ